MSATVNIAIFDLLKSQTNAALTNFYNALKDTDEKSVEFLKVFHQQMDTVPRKPYCVFSRTVGNYAKHLKGDSGLDQSQYSFIIHGRNPFDHPQIAELLRLAISALINVTISGVNFRSIFIQDDPDNLLPPTNNSQKSSYSTTAQYDITYAVPKANAT